MPDDTTWQRLTTALDPGRGAPPSATVPYATPRWVTAALATRTAEQQAFTFTHDEGGGTSMLSLFVAPARHRGVPVRHASVLGETWSAVDLPPTPTGARLLADWLCSPASGRWQLATIGPIADPARLPALLARLNERGVRHALVPGESQFLLLATSWEAFLEARSRNFRRNVKRKAKAFEEAGLVVRHTSNPGVDELRRTVFAVSDRSWQGQMGVAVAAQGAGRQLYERLGGRGTDFSLELSSAWHGETCVAYLLGVHHGDVYRALDTGFDAMWSTAAPGTVLHHAMLERMCAAGVREIDLGSVHDYKERFEAETRPAPLLRIYRSRPLFALDRLARHARRFIRR